MPSGPRPPRVELWGWRLAAQANPDESPWMLYHFSMRGISCSSAARWGSAALVVLTTSGFSAPAAAQKSGGPASPPAAPAPSSDELRAHEIYQQGAAAYREGRFKEAEALLLQAYAIAPKPVLLYNLARVYEGTGEFGKAADAYARYLDAEPAARDRGALTQRIATLRAEIAERERLKREHDSAAAAEPERARPKPVVLPWIVGGVGVAGLITGGVFGVIASSRHSEAQDEYFQQDAARAQEDAAGYRDIANVCFVAGGILAVGGAVWTVLALRANGDANASAGPARQQRGLDVRPIVGLGALGLEVKGL